MHFVVISAIIPSVSLLGIRWIFVHGEKLICQHHSTRIAGERRGVRGAGNITANRSVFCLRIGNIYRGSCTNKFEEFG